MNLIFFIFVLVLKINLMKKQKTILNKKSEPKPIFCTECGEDLTEFDFSDNADNPEKVKERLNNCKKIGKFNGEFCAMYFIASDHTLDSVWNDSD